MDFIGKKMTLNMAVRGYGGTILLPPKKRSLKVLFIMPVYQFKLTDLCGSFIWWFGREWGDVRWS